MWQKPTALSQCRLLIFIEINVLHRLFAAQNTDFCFREITVIYVSYEVK